MSVKTFFVLFVIFFCEVYMDFKERLRVLRTSNNITAKSVAELLGMTYRNYQRYENGLIEPSLSTLIALADYFQVSLDYLVGRSDLP